MRYLETILVMSVGLLALAFKEIKYEFMSDKLFRQEILNNESYMCVN